MDTKFEYIRKNSDADDIRNEKDEVCEVLKSDFKLIPTGYIKIDRC